MMDRNWDDYHSRQLYSECQLISALNAWHYWTGEKIEQDSPRYEHLVDLCKARYGAAIKIGKVHEELGLCVSQIFENDHDLINHLNEWRISLPLEINVWHHKYGFHSVLVVDFHQHTGTLRVTNFDRVTTLDGWVFLENFRYFIRSPNNGWFGRVLYLNGH